MRARFISCCKVPNSFSLVDILGPSLVASEVITFFVKNGSFRLCIGTSLKETDISN